MSGTAIILLLTILISLLGLLSPRFIGGALLRPYLIARGSNYETLLTSGFVHADLGHLIFNLITLYSFGPPLEREIGTARFLLLYLCGLLVSGIGTCIKHRNELNYASLGASGAILAVLFASIVYFPHERIFILPLPVPIPAPLFALAYLAFSYYSAHRAASRSNVPPTLPAPAPPAPASDPTAAPDSAAALPEAATPQAAPAARSPAAAEPMQPRDRINHDAHIFGALTGLAFVLITSPERFRALLHYLTG
jgi:membrane associated rhomboid family serine protease